MNQKRYTNCPHCNTMLVITAASERKTEADPYQDLRPETRQRIGAWQRQDVGKLESSLPTDSTLALPPPGGIYTKRTPTRAPSKEADVIVPGLRALIGGTALQCLIWLSIYGGVGYFNFWGFLVSYIGILYVSWEIAIRGFDKLLIVYEEIGEALSRDEPEPPASPEEPQHTVNVVIQDEAKHHTQIKRTHLPNGITYELFAEFCYGIIHDGKTFGRGQWARNPNKVMTEAQWKALIEHCEKLKYIESGVGGQYELTAMGKRTFNAVADNRTRIV